MSAVIERTMGRNTKILFGWILSQDSLTSGEDFKEMVVRLAADGTIFECTERARLATFKLIDDMKATEENPHGDNDEAIAADMVRMIGVLEQRKSTN